MVSVGVPIEGPVDGCLCRLQPCTSATHGSFEGCVYQVESLAPHLLKCIQCRAISMHMYLDISKASGQCTEALRGAWAIVHNSVTCV